MHVLNNQEPRLASAEALDQLAGRAPLAIEPGGVVHRIVDRVKLGRLSEVEKIVEVDELFGIDVSFCGGSRGRIMTGGGVRGDFQAEKAADQRPDGVLSLARAEIEHQGLVRRDTLGLRLPHELLDEPRLADARLATDVDQMPSELIEAGPEKTAKLRKFGLASDEWTGPGRLGFGYGARNAPYAERVRVTLKRDLACRTRIEAFADSLLDGLRDEHLAGFCPVHQTGRQIHRFSRDGIIAMRGAAGGGGHHLANATPT